jgi:hypothetical protein
VIGRVASITHHDDTERPGLSRYVLRVERALNVRLGDRVVVRSSPYSSSRGVSWRVGQRVGAFLDRTRRGWRTFLYTLAKPFELERARSGPTRARSAAAAWRCWRAAASATPA